MIGTPLSFENLIKRLRISGNRKEKLSAVLIICLIKTDFGFLKFLRVWFAQDNILTVPFFWNVIGVLAWLADETKDELFEPVRGFNQIADFPQRAIHKDVETYIVKLASPYNNDIKRIWYKLGYGSHTCSYCFVCLIKFINSKPLIP